MNDTTTTISVLKSITYCPDPLNLFFDLYEDCTHSTMSDVLS